jgi:hypothetical protein
VEQALKQSGDNRSELEKVLLHYSQNPADSLKYRAACFLIGNMPLHFSYRSAMIDTFKTANRLAGRKQTGLKEALEELANRHGSLSRAEAEKVYDVHVAGSGFLISNIDLAFRAWQEMPYGRHYGFSEFCEYILPYRVRGEQMEDWRELFYRTFKPLVDTAAHPEDPVYVAKIINDYLIGRGFNFFFSDNVPSMGPVTLLNDPFGTCQEMTSLTAYALRSVGIPCGIDMMVQRPDMEGKHFWNFMIDTTRLPVAFAGLEKSPARGVVPAHKLGKVYREYYSLQKESLPYTAERGTYMPASLATPFIRDVSAEYMENNTIEIEPRIRTQNPYFLSVFDNHGWVPVDWTVSGGDTATFHNVENNSVYIVLTHNGTELVPVCHPFTVLDSRAVFLKPDHDRLTDMRVERKYLIKDVAYTRMKGMVGGMFHGANREDFSDAVLLWRIAGYPRFCFQYADIPPSGRTYRYFRYTAPDGTKANVSEIEAFDREGNRIEGRRVFGTKGYNWSALEYIYDGDPLSYYEAEEDATPVWAAVDFGEPREIGSLRYICRNDDNSVREGDQYELFYCDDTGWHSLGRRTGDRNHAFEYKNVPAGALYWLRDYTRGKEERIFTCENEKQAWW